jgi:uncharacterized protein involved in exopolysaccharide biosynthesis
MSAKEAALAQLLADARKELETLNDNEIRVARLKREMEIQDANYRKYAVDTEQARIDHSLEAARISNITVAQPPTLESYPASPVVPLNLFLGFMAAACLSTGLAFASESHRRWKQHAVVRFSGRKSPVEKEVSPRPTETPVYSERTPKVDPVPVGAQQE